MLDLLAAATVEDPISGKVAVSIIGAVMTGLAGIFGGKKWADARKIQVEPQPLMVRLEEKFVTKEEFKDFKSDVRLDVKEMKGLFAQAVEKIEERDDRLSKRIDDRDERLVTRIDSVAKGAYEARGKMHLKINDQGERLRSLEDRTPKANGRH